MDKYIGTIGGISANVGMNKVIKDYDDIDRENEENLNNGGIIVEIYLSLSTNIITQKIFG